MNYSAWCARAEMRSATSGTSWSYEAPPGNVRAMDRFTDAFPVVQAFDEEVIRAGFRPGQLALGRSL